MPLVNPDFESFDYFVLNQHLRPQDPPSLHKEGIKAEEDNKSHIAGRENCRYRNHITRDADF